MAEIAEAAESYNDAELLFKKAVEFSPTNYVLVGRLATFYRDWYQRTGEPVMRDRALEAYKKAVFLAPTDGNLYYRYLQFRNAQEWQPVKDTTS